MGTLLQRYRAANLATKSTGKKDIYILSQYMSPYITEIYDEKNCWDWLGLGGGGWVGEWVYFVTQKKMVKYGNNLHGG